MEVMSSLGFFSRLFLVPKPNKQWRPVIDLSLLNNYIRYLRSRWPHDKKVCPLWKKADGSSAWTWRMPIFKYQIILHPGSSSVWSSWKLDNWMGHAQSKQEAQTRCHLLVRIWAHLGFLIKYQTSEIIPHKSSTVWYTLCPTQVFGLCGAECISHRKLGQSHDHSPEIRVKSIRLVLRNNNSSSNFTFTGFGTKIKTHPKNSHLYFKQSKNYNSCGQYGKI